MIGEIRFLITRERGETVHTAFEWQLARKNAGGELQRHRIRQVLTRMGIRRGGYDHRPFCLLGNALQICRDIVVR